jgi:hypothetical protein
MQKYIDDLNVIAAEEDLSAFLLEMGSDAVSLDATKKIGVLLGETGAATRFCQLYFSASKMHEQHVEIVKSLGLFVDDATSCKTPAFILARTKLFIISVAQTLNRDSGGKHSVKEMLVILEGMIHFKGHLPPQLSAIVESLCPSLANAAQIAPC